MKNEKNKKRVFSTPPNYFYACFILNMGILCLPPIGPDFSDYFYKLGVVLILAGIYLIFSAYYQFKKQNTPVKFVPSCCVVTTGIYHWSRNPMYLGFLAVLLGATCMIGNLIGLISPFIFFAVVNWMFIPYEEEKMECEHGDVYLNYKNRVRRWL